MKTSKKDEEKIEWFCYYCGQYLGTSSRSGGAKIGKCPKCYREQVGPGIAVVPKEVTSYLRRLEKRRKEEKKLRNRARD